MSLGAFSLDQLMELAGLSVSQVGMFCISYLVFRIPLFGFIFSSFITFSWVDRGEVDGGGVLVEGLTCFPRRI